MQTITEDVVELTEIIKNKKMLDELKKTRLLIIDRRIVNLHIRNRRKEDKKNDLSHLVSDADEILQEKYFNYPPDKFYIETVTSYEDAKQAAKATAFDFFIFYKLIYENKKDAAILISELLKINTSWSNDPFYLIAYRSMATLTEHKFYEADTAFERYFSIKDESDCKSDVEKVIVKCKEYALADRLKHIVLVGDLRSETMISLMEKLSAERYKYIDLKCIAYENNEFLDFKEQKKRKGYFLL